MKVNMEISIPYVGLLHTYLKPPSRLGSGKPWDGLGVPVSFNQLHFHALPSLNESLAAKHMVYIWKEKQKTKTTKTQVDTAPGRWLHHPKTAQKFF